MASGFTQLLFCVIFFLSESRIQVIKKLIAYKKHWQKDLIILCGNGCPVQVQVVRSCTSGALHACLQRARAQVCESVKSLIEYNLDSTLIHLGK